MSPVLLGFDMGELLLQLNVDNNSTVRNRMPGPILLPGEEVTDNVEIFRSLGIRSLTVKTLHQSQNPFFGVVAMEADMSAKLLKQRYDTQLYSYSYICSYICNGECLCISHFNSLPSV